MQRADGKVVDLRAASVREREREKKRRARSEENARGAEMHRSSGELRVYISLCRYYVQDLSKSLSIAFPKSVRSLAPCLGVDFESCYIGGAGANKRLRLQF